MHLDLQNSNTTLKMGVFFTIKILEMGVFFMVKIPLKGGLSQCHSRPWEYRVNESEPRGWSIRVSVFFFMFPISMAP